MFINIVIILAIILILVLIGVMFIMPTEERKRKKKRRQAEEPVIDVPKLERTIAKLQKSNTELGREISQWQKKEAEYQKSILIEGEKAKKFHEKLIQERGWHEKEHKDIERKNKQFLTLKDELVKVQENYSKEHAINLRLEKESKEHKHDWTNLLDKKNALETEILGLKKRIEEQRKDMLQLKKENIVLTKKKEDTQWIAKTDYIALEEKYKLMEKEMERLVRQRDQEKK